jgi:hypothetical protein
MLFKINWGLYIGTFVCFDSNLIWFAYQRFRKAKMFSTRSWSFVESFERDCHSFKCESWRSNVLSLHYRHILTHTLSSFLFFLLFTWAYEISQLKILILEYLVEYKDGWCGIGLWVVSDVVVRLYFMKVNTNPQQHFLLIVVHSNCTS